jgi:hypothetical protein
MLLQKRNFLIIITSHLKSLNIYNANYWAYIFMFCKLQHGIKKGTWYLQIMKVRQVSECAWLDWCNLIGMQITTTYKIRTKYYENMRLNKHKESSKTNIGNHFFSQIVLFSNHPHCQFFWTYFNVWSRASCICEIF